jgi:CRP-like cAMP-binding protein
MSLADKFASHDPMERLPRTPRDVMTLLDGQPLFAGMTQRERGPFADVAEVVRCVGNTCVFAHGEEGRYLYLVLQGRLALRFNDKAAGVAGQCEVGPGQSAGSDAWMSQRTHDFSCVAVQNTAALRFPTAPLRTWLLEGRTGAVKLFAALRIELAEHIRRSAEELGALLDQAVARSAPISAVWEVGQPHPPSGVHPATSASAKR